MLPNFIIIGAQKSASTLLHQYLARHPDVFMPLHEVPIFEDPEYQTHGIDGLHALFATAPADRVRGIKRPDYLARIECAERISRHVPDAKLLATLRDPVDRAVSAYYHYMREGWIPVRPLEKGMVTLLEGGYDHRHRRGNEILDFGFYHRHLQEYRARFTPEQLSVTLHEDLVRDPQTVLRPMCAFLGITQDWQPPIIGRAKQGLYSIPRLRYRQAVRPLIRTKTTDGLRSVPRTGHLGTWARRIDTVVLSRVLPDRKPVLSSELRERLAGLYRADLERLQDDLGRDLGHWLPLST